MVVWKASGHSWWKSPSATRAEAALAASEGKYRRLHESMRDAFATADLEGRIGTAIEPTRKCWGTTLKNSPRSPTRILTPHKWHARTAEIHQTQVFARGYSDIFEKEYRQKTARYSPLKSEYFS